MTAHDKEVLERLGFVLHDTPISAYCKRYGWRGLIVIHCDYMFPELFRVARSKQAQSDLAELRKEGVVK